MKEILTVKLKMKAVELGFDAAGFAPAAPLKLAETSIREKVESGMLKDYGFSRRPAWSFTHPEKILPEAKSMVVVALSYYRGESEHGSLKGRIARFAWGRDYHTVVEERLRKLGEWLTEQCGAKYKVCVDTGPLIDRAAAREAGIGSYGKNTSIITKKAGSWVVIGELITDVELDFDAPAPLEECGDCTICISACPTGAIVKPFTTDQTRCISHLTQMNGIIREDLRHLIGSRVYGCDTCQEVCPKNRQIISRQSKGDELWGMGGVELIPNLNISQEEFDQTIGPTAAAWIGRARFRRNIAVALGNIGDTSAIPALTKALADPDPIIRTHAAWAINRISKK